MNGLDPIGRPGEGLEGRRLIRLQELGNLGLLRREGGDLPPGQGLLEVPPDPLTGVACWASGRQAHQAHGRGEDQVLGAMCPTVIAAPDLETRGESRGNRGKAALKPLRLPSGPFQEAPVAGPGLHGAVDVAPREDVWPGADGLDAPGGEAPAADGPSAAPAVGWAAHPEGTNMVRREGLPAVVVTGGLEGREGLRGCRCASAGPPCAWS